MQTGTSIGILDNLIHEAFSNAETNEAIDVTFKGNEPVQADKHPPGIKWIYSGFERDVQIGDGAG